MYLCICVYVHGRAHLVGIAWSPGIIERVCISLVVCIYYTGRTRGIPTHHTHIPFIYEQGAMKIKNKRNKPAHCERVLFKQVYFILFLFFYHKYPLYYLTWTFIYTFTYMLFLPIQLRTRINYIHTTVMFYNMNAKIMQACVQDNADG